MTARQPPVPTCATVEFTSPPRPGNYLAFVTLPGAERVRVRRLPRRTRFKCDQCGPQFKDSPVCPHAAAATAALRTTTNRKATKPMLITRNTENALAIDSVLANPVVGPLVADLVPEAADLKAQAQRLIREAGSIQPVVEQDATAPIRAALESGKPLPDLVETLGELGREAIRFNTTRTALNGILDDIEGRRAALCISASGPILAALTGRLEAIVADYRTNPARSISDAQEAIEAGLTKQWQQLADLEATYASARAGYLLVARNFVGGALADEAHNLPLHATLANPHEVWADWPLYATAGRDRDGYTTRPPWPNPTDHRAFLRWLGANPTAKPWAPSMAQLDQAVSDARRLARQKTEETHA